jgi:hypothetical protein
MMSYESCDVMAKLSACYVNICGYRRVVVLGVKVSAENIMCELSNDLSIQSSMATKQEVKQAAINTNTYCRFAYKLFKT